MTEGDYLPSAADMLAVIRWVRQLQPDGASVKTTFDPQDALILWRPLIESIDNFIRHAKHALIPEAYRSLKNWHNPARRRERIAELIISDPYPPHNYKDEWFRSHTSLAQLVKTGEIFAGDNLSDSLRGLSDNVGALEQFGMAVWSCGYATHSEWLAVLVELTRGIPRKPDKARDVVPPSESLDAEQSKRSRREEARKAATIRTLTDKIEALGNEHRDTGLKHTAELADERKSSENLKTEMRHLTREQGKDRSTIQKLREQLAHSERALEDAKAVGKEALVQLDVARLQQADLVGSLADLENKGRDIKAALDQVPVGSEAVNIYIARELEEANLRSEVDQGEPGRRASARKAQLKQFKDLFLQLEPSYEQTQVRPTTPLRKGRLQFDSLGGGNEVGASCYLLRVGADEVLIDAGLRVKRDLDNMGPDLSRWDYDEPAFEAVLITHAHGDHSGWLPVLAAKWDFFDIYCTVETSRLLPIMLEDSYGNHQRAVAAASVRAQRLGHSPPQLPYSRDNLESALRWIKPMHYGAPKAVGQRLNFQFLRAGHILGAASILLEGWGRRILVTGDYATFPQETVLPANWEDATNGGEIDLLVSEATYGIPRERSRNSEIERFFFFVQNTLRRRGSVLIPCFALGRAQEVLSLIRLAFERGTLAPCPVWIDGLIDRVNPIYEASTHFKLSSHFRNRRSGWEISEVIGELSHEPGIVVTTSGMLAGGPAIEYCKQLLPDRVNQLILCGYQDAESPGGKLIRDATETDASRRILSLIEEDGRETRIKLGSSAEHVQLSAHSDQHEMVGAITKLKPNHTVLVHGEPDSRRKLADALRRRGLSVESEPVITLEQE